MIYVKEKVGVEITEDMVCRIEETLDALAQLQKIVETHDFTIQNSHDDEIWFDLDDLCQTIKLLETLADPDCEFVE